MEIQVYSPRDCPVCCPGRQSANRSPFPRLNFCEGAETQSQWEPGKSGHSWWLPPTLPPLLRLYEILQPHHTNQPENGRGCHGDRALFKAQEWCSLLFSVFSCGEKVSVAVVFHMNFGLRAKPKVECSSEGLEDGKCRWTFWMGCPFSNIFQSVLITSAKLRNCTDFVKQRLKEKEQGKKYGSGTVKV